MCVKGSGTAKGRMAFCVMIGAVLLGMAGAKLTGVGRSQMMEITHYVYRCIEGHWQPIGDRPVFTCD